MKKTLAAAAFLLLASNAAQAQYQFEYGGRTIRIDPDRGTVQIPGVYDNTGKKSKSKKPTEAKSDPAPPPAPRGRPPPRPPCRHPPLSRRRIPERRHCRLPCCTIRLRPPRHPQWPP